VRLTDFSQYAPVDGRPAEDATEILVFYSPTAIYFGVKARAAAGSVHATLANRDRIDADDAIQIFLDPFRDGRQALVFGVNPLGIQSDGALVEGTNNRGGAAFGGLESGREGTDSRPTTSTSRRVGSPPTATRSKSPSRSRRCASPPIAFSRGRSTSSGSSRAAARRTAGRRRSAPTARSSRSRERSTASPTCSAGWCSISTRWRRRTPTAPRLPAAGATTPAGRSSAVTSAGA
jgi:hypothetical protein